MLVAGVPIQESLIYQLLRLLKDLTAPHSATQTQHMSTHSPCTPLLTHILSLIAVLLATMLRSSSLSLNFHISQVKLLISLELVKVLSQTNIKVLLSVFAFGMNA